MTLFSDRRVVEAASNAIYVRTRGAAVPGVLTTGDREIPVSHVGTEQLAVDALSAAVAALPRDELVQEMAWAIADGQPGDSISDPEAHRAERALIRLGLIPESTKEGQNA